MIIYIHKKNILQVMAKNKQQGPKFKNASKKL